MSAKFAIDRRMIQAAFAAFVDEPKNRLLVLSLRRSQDRHRPEASAPPTGGGATKASRLRLKRQSPLRRGKRRILRLILDRRAGGNFEPLVELRGFEPLTSAVRLQRSP